MFKRFEHPRHPVIPPSLGKPAQLMVEQVLDSCLKDIQVHHKRLSDCLRKYPSYADELRPLLTIAVEIKALASVSPSATFRRDLRRQLLRPQDAGPLQSSQFMTVRSPSYWKRALLVLVLLMAISFSLWGVVAALNTSLPGSLLYPIKRWAERIQVGLAEEPAASLHAGLARRRLDEVKALASYGEAELANQTAVDYEGEINSAIDGLLADQKNRTSDQVLREQLIEEQAELESLQTEIPDSSIRVVQDVQAALTKLIDRLDTLLAGTNGRAAACDCRSRPLGDSRRWQSHQPKHGFKSSSCEDERACEWHLACGTCAMHECRALETLNTSKTEPRVGMDARQHPCPRALSKAIASLVPRPVSHFPRRVPTQILGRSMNAFSRVSIFRCY